MGSQPQNPEFRINPENFHPCSSFEHPKHIKENIHNFTLKNVVYFNLC